MSVNPPGGLSIEETRKSFFFLSKNTTVSIMLVLENSPDGDYDVLRRSQKC